MSNQESEFKSVDEKADYDIVHFLKLGKANGFASRLLNPGPQSQMFALDLLCIVYSACQPRAVPGEVAG